MLGLLREMLGDIHEMRANNQKNIDFYRNMYFSTKKSKKISRKARSRIMKHAEKEWSFWQSLDNGICSILSV